MAVGGADDRAGGQAGDAVPDHARGFHVAEERDGKGGAGFAVDEDAVRVVPAGMEVGVGALHEAELGAGGEARVQRFELDVAGRNLSFLVGPEIGAAEVVVTDDSAFRRERIAALGVLPMTEAEAATHAKARWHHGGTDRGADVVFQTRGHPSSLANALRALRPQGAVIDLAFYQGGADVVDLGREFHHNGLSIRCAQIGRVPRGLGTQWDRRRLSGETARLLRARGRDIREQVITHVVPMADAPRFIDDLVRERPDFLQIVFSL